MSFVAVLPSIWPPYTDACIASMAPELLERTVVVDNTVRNRGVAASWNRGVDYLYTAQADWLVLISAAMRFGAPGGLDFLEALRGADGHEWAVEAGECPRAQGTGFGWHLVAFPQRTFDRVGRFDENFWPAYFEDLDFGHRIRVASRWQGGDPMWPKVEVDADLVSFAHGVHLAGVDQDPTDLIRYYSRKWGLAPGGSGLAYEHPFGREEHGLDFWPTPAGSREERLQ